MNLGNKRTSKPSSPDDLDEGDVFAAVFLTALKKEKSETRTAKEPLKSQADDEQTTPSRKLLQHGYTANQHVPYRNSSNTTAISDGACRKEDTSSRPAAITTAAGDSSSCPPPAPPAPAPENTNTSSSILSSQPVVPTQPVKTRTIATQTPLLAHYYPKMADYLAQNGDIACLRPQRQHRQQEQEQQKKDVSIAGPNKPEQSHQRHQHHQYHQHNNFLTAQNTAFANQSDLNTSLQSHFFGQEIRSSIRNNTSLTSEQNTGTNTNQQNHLQRLPPAKYDHFNRAKIDIPKVDDDFDVPRFKDGIELQFRDLLNARDRMCTSQFTAHIVDQLDFIYFQNPDRRSHRHHLPLGYRGFCCRYCRTNPGQSGRFFPSTLKTLSDSKKTLFALHVHFVKCPATPAIVKQQLCILRQLHPAQIKPTKARGGQRAFFRRVWGFLCNEKKIVACDFEKKKTLTMEESNPKG